ncbi:hypothetical protein [Shewanella sp. YIC-542]|uniref:hypothetical protein n=1 Tax=Shewanella mytili TaxID=3377111 RepID=UPI00398E3C83
MQKLMDLLEKLASDGTLQNEALRKAYIQQSGLNASLTHTVLHADEAHLKTLLNIAPLCCIMVPAEDAPDEPEEKGNDKQAQEHIAMR